MEIKQRNNAVVALTLRRLSQTDYLDYLYTECGIPLLSFPDFISFIHSLDPFFCS